MANQREEQNRKAKISSNYRTFNRWHPLVLSFQSQSQPMTNINTKEAAPQIAYKIMPIFLLGILWMKKQLMGYVTSYESVTTSAFMYKLKLSLSMSINGPQQSMQMKVLRLQTAIEINRMEGYRNKSSGVQILCFNLGF